ncbi:MAG: GGDEF domain-containing protein, partial [Pseudomonadota bacterium]
EFFVHRQVAQCNGGDRRVLEHGEIDEAYETVFEADGTPRETITRKSRLTLGDGSVFLVGVMHDVTEVVTANHQLKTQSDQLRLLAETDPLTKCLNRRALFEATAAETNPNSAVLLLDIDLFKSINDTYGHNAGDAALLHFVDIARSQIRKDDLFARIGGEEFVVYLPSTSVDEFNAAAERIRSAVEAQPFVYDGKSISMTVSIGGSLSERDKATTLDQLLRTSDQRLYKAKSGGRNKAVLAA